MNVELRTGDLFEQPDLKAIAHGVNCAGAMSRGISVGFRQRWPEMYEEYRLRCELRLLRVGDVFEWEEGPVTIFNLATQPDGKHPATLPNIRSSVERMAHVARLRGIDRVGIPRIGAGLGGLAW